MRIQKSLLVCYIALTCLGAQGASTVTFHVAPDGNDQWSGRKARPTWFKKDGPFASIQRALEAGRDLRRSSGAEARVSIVLQKGAYYLKEPLRLLPEDSGLSISGEGIISGGLRLTNWWAGSINGRTALMAKVPQGMVFHQLWVNGRRATPARHPNTNYFNIESTPDSTPSWEAGQSRFVYKEGDIPAAWREIDPEAKVVIMCRWIESHLPVASIQAPNRLISFKKKSVFQLDQHSPWYLQGLMDALDNTGEWFLDSKKRVVYYLPRPGEAPENVEVIAPVLQQVLRFEGEPAKNRFISGISVKGLTFSHTEWNYPAPKGTAELESGGSVQAAYAVPGSVYAAGLRDSIFEDCQFKNLGAYGLELSSGCRSNRVIRCKLSDLAAGGVKIGEIAVRAGEEQTSSTEVRDCRIFDGGKVYHSAVGIWIGQSPNNVVVGNEIYDFFYTGISVGWTWGYGPSLTTNNLIAGNQVHHIGRKSDGDGPILSDMGGIYTLGMQPGTRIINNLWHDIAGLRYGGWGIYFDEGSSSILAVSNIVWNTTHGGFHQHYGATNRVWNNIFAYARDHQLQRTRPEPHSSFSFKTNIVLIDQGAFLGGNWHEGKIETDYNLFFDTRQNAQTNGTFAGMTLSQWQQRGNDTNSVVGDPLFVDPQAHDFRLKQNSPATALGFQQITPP